MTTRQFNSFYVVGAEREQNVLGKNADQFYNFILDKLRASAISEPLKSDVLTGVRSILYYRKLIYIIEARAQKGPSHFDSRFYVRQGANVIEATGDRLAALFSRFTT